MLSVIEPKKTITLRVRQVTPFDTHLGVLRELLEGLPRKPRLLLLDRGFYSVDVVSALKSTGLHFLMPAPRTLGIKRACEAFERGELPALSRYTMHGQHGETEVWLVLDRRKTKDGWRTFAFISTLPFDPKTAAELYGWRWRIETSNRELKHFLALTTTQDMKLRRIYYRLATFLYNLWIALRHSLGDLTKHGFKREMLGFLNLWLRIPAGIKPPPE
jgi:IS4 transposase